MFSKTSAEQVKRIGVPKEIKNHEYRVGLAPESVSEPVSAGHQISVESSAGNGIKMSDRAHIVAGARICSTAEEIFGEAEMFVRVKEPQAAERIMLQEGQILYTYLHVAPTRIRQGI